jgi:hypothetical protein
MAFNLVVATGCELATEQEAVDQLNRGPRRQVEFDLAIAQDTFALGSIFDSLGVGLDTLPDGLLAIVPDTVNFAIVIPFTVPGIALDTTFTPPPIWQTVDSAMLNLGEFSDVMRDASLNTALAALDVSNSADAPVEFVNYRLGVVPVIGGVLDSVGGEPAFVTDSVGVPIVVDVVDSGSTVFALARGQTSKIDSLQAAPVVDVLVDRILAGDTVALVGIGDLHVGDGSTITQSAGASLAFNVVPIVGLDLTLGSGGAGISLPNLIESGLDLDSELVDDLVDNVLDSVGIEIAVENGVAFGLQVETALVGDSVTGDIFTVPGAVLDTLVVSAAVVDTKGQATQATADTTGLVLDNVDVRQALGRYISVGVRVRLLPPAGGRGRIHDRDELRVAVRARVWVSVGTAQ